MVSLPRGILTGLILGSYNQAESFPARLARPWGHGTFSQIRYTFSPLRAVCEPDPEWPLALTELTTHKPDPRIHYKMEVCS